MATITRAIKFAIYFEGLSKKDMQATCFDIARAQGELTRAANKIAHILYLIRMGSLEHPCKEDGSPKSYDTIANDCVKLKGPWTPFPDRPIYEPKGPRLSSANLAATTRAVSKRVATDMKKVREGDAQLVTFRTQPLTLRADGITITAGTEPDTFLIDLSVWGNLPKGQGHIVVKPILGHREQGQREILKRLVAGTYEHGDAKLYKDERKGKWMLSLPWTGEVTAKTGNYIAGIDLGIMTAVTIAYVDVVTGKVAPFRDRVVIPRTIMDAWNAVESERKARLHRNRRVFEPSAEEQKPGRGVTRKIRPANILTGKKARLTEEAVRQVAAAVVKCILRRRCQGAALEDLSWSHAKMLEDTENLSNRDKARARKNSINKWLQVRFRSHIAQALEREGIPSTEVDPRDSSNTCGACGTVWQRPPRPKDGSPRPYCTGFGRLNQAMFKCSCGHEDHADHNAAGVLGQRGRPKLLVAAPAAQEAAK